MSNEINSLNDLRSTTIQADIEGVGPKNLRGTTQAAALSAALERQEEEKRQAELRELEELKKKREDGREYELEVCGFNIGDSAYRRRMAADSRAKEIVEIIQAEEQIKMELELEKELGTLEVHDDLEEIATIKDEDNVLPFTPDSDDDIIDEDFGDWTPEESEEIMEENNILVDTDEEVIDTTFAEETTTTNRGKFDIDSDDFKDAEDFYKDEEEVASVESDTEEDDSDIDEEDSKITEEDLKKLEVAIKEALKSNKVKPAHTNRVKSAISLNQIMSLAKKEATIAQFPLIFAGKNIEMSKFSGSDIESLNPNNETKSRFAIQKDIYKVIYDHVTNKGNLTFEEWLDTVNLIDIDYVFMAIYAACFGSANYIPYKCESKDCGEVFLSENTPISAMYSFENEEAEKRFNDIKNCPDATGIGALYEPVKVDVSDYITIEFRFPSVWNGLFENAALDSKFVAKYSNIIDLFIYISKIYYRDNNGDLHEIMYKQDKANPAKSAKYRIMAFSNIFKNAELMDSDAYNAVIREIVKIRTIQAKPVMTFHTPECKCVKCGNTIKKDPQNPSSLVFTRHQLNLIASAED